MQLLFQNSLYNFHLLNDKQTIILFDWTDKTLQMTYEDFQESCHNYAGFAWQYQAKHLMVNTCNFQFQLPTNFVVWREVELNPRYYSLGVQKFAYITKPTLLEFTKDVPAQEGKFETKNFDSNETAIDWLNL